MKKITLIVLALIIITGCVHHSPFQSGEYYYQAMGRDGEIVMTMDATSAKEEKPELNENPILERTERVSVALEPDESDSYPLPIENWTMYGALEGNFGKVLVPMAISSIDGFERVKDSSAKYYSNGEISLGVPETGLLLFSTGDYLEAKDRTLDNRTLLIPSEIATEMGENLMSIYVKSPRTMIELGFDIPYAVLSQMAYALITISTNDGLYYMSATVAFQSERSAMTFTTLMRNMVVQEIRREGGALDFKALSDMIKAEANVSFITNKEIGEDEVDKYLDMALSISGGIL